jgi:hypothetical protein
MSRLTKREKLGLKISVFIVMVYSYSAFFLTPINMKSKALKQSILEYKEIGNSKLSDGYGSVIKNGDKTGTPQSLEAVYGKQQLQHLQEKLPDMEKNSEIAYNIKVAAEKANITLNTIEIGEAATFKSSPPVKFVPLVLRFTGSLNQIIELLRSIENQSRICEINRASIRIGSSIGSNDNYIQKVEDTNTKLEVNIRYFFTGAD